ALSSGTVTLKPGASVGTVQQGITLAPLVHRTVIVQPPSGTPSDVSIQPGAAATLPPGLYGTVTIRPSAVVTVSAGTYVVDTFVLGPQAELRLDTSGGTVTMYVNTAVTWQGAVSGDASRFVLGFFGQGSLRFETVFRGTALAPFGTLQLAPTSTAYQG